MNGTRDDLAAHRPGMGREPALVSVVTPAYNAEAFLRATIESVRNQDYPRIEHLVMDGGSTDGTLRVLEAYPEVVWFSERDRGQSDALNKGFRRASGEIIGWLNADDSYRPGAVSAAAAHLTAHPETDVVCGDVNVIDEHGRVVGVSTGRPFDTMELLTYNMVKQPTVFMRRRVIDALGGVDERYHYVMDQELWLRLGMAGFRVDYLAGRTLADFRLCEGTKSFRDGPSFHEEWQSVLLRVLEQPYFRTVPAGVKRRALSVNRAAYHVARALQAIEGGRRLEVADQLLRALAGRPALLLNPGLWRFAALGLIGRSPSPWRRYARNAARKSESVVGAP